MDLCSHDIEVQQWEVHLRYQKMLNSSEEC
jgi:hypothetical protein